MAITQDGYAQNGHHGTPSTVTLTTTNSNDIIVLAAFDEAWPGPGPYTVTGVSSPNTTGWTKRSSTTDANIDTGAALDVWYGKAAAPLTNEVITVSFSSAPDGSNIVAAGFSGVDQTTVWDTNGSLPASATSHVGTQDPSVSGVSTSAVNTMLLAFAGSGNGTVISTPPSGWSNWGTPVTFNAPGFWAQCTGSLQAETAPQSGLTVTYGTAVANWIMVVDALRAAGQAVITKSSAYTVGF